MASFNKVILLGNLTRDPEIRTLPSGDPVANFGLACNRRFPSKDGTEREETLFIDVAMFGKRGEVIGRFFKKGSPILIEGRLKMDQWERDGRKQNKITVVAENFEFVEPRGGRPPVEPVEPPDAGGGRDASAGPGSGGAPAGGPPVEDEDNMPF